MRVKTRQTISGNDSLSANTVLENCKWYARGYRYPVFETVRTVLAADSVESAQFETAFFYPPQDHYYLDGDEANLALLESDTTEKPADPREGVNYNLYPNPVTAHVNVELYLPRTAQVKLQLRTQAGYLLLNENKGSKPQGLHHLQLGLPALQAGNYLLTILLDDCPISEIIMKR